METNYENGEVLITKARTQTNYRDPAEITFTINGVNHPVTAKVDAAKLLNFCVNQKWVEINEQGSQRKAG